MKEPTGVRKSRFQITTNPPECINNEPVKNAPRHLCGRAPKAKQKKKKLISSAQRAFPDRRMLDCSSRVLQSAVDVSIAVGVEALGLKHGALLAWFAAADTAARNFLSRRQQIAQT